MRRGKDGLYVEPTIFKQTPNTSRIVQEEVFGPVVTVHTFKTEEEAVSISRLRGSCHHTDISHRSRWRTIPSLAFLVRQHPSSWGISMLTHGTACVYTESISRALRVTRQIEAGTIAVK